MRTKYLEDHLIRHCAPTLASIKTSNLFCYTFTSMTALVNDLSGANTILNRKGVYAEVLRICGNSALIFVYRLSNLCEDLNKPGVIDILSDFGYCGSLSDYVSRLKSRLMCCDEFPHEIGLFLGYPLQDVVGFIENEGRNSKHTGCWKVYSNEWETIRLFARFKKCTEIYTRLFSQGRSIERLTVAA